jgi:ABC-2 type transport system ATP-binding protein
MRCAPAAELLERFDLTEAARQTPATYSGGMTPPRHRDDPDGAASADLPRRARRLGDDIVAEDLSIHTPDLDDVFFALTGNPAKEQIP